MKRVGSFSAFLVKEFRHMLRDSRTLFILLVLPLLLITIMGYVVSTEVRGTRVVIVDEVQTQESHLLTQRIDANRYFSVVDCVPFLRDYADPMQRNEADVVVLISDQGIQLISDGSEPNLAKSRTMYLTSLIGSGMQSGIGVKMLYNPQLLSEYNFIPGIIGLIVMLICAMMTSIAIVREKEMGTMEILLASPLSPLTIILCKLVPYFVVSSINVVTILLVSHFVMGMPIAGSLVAYFGIFCLYVITSLALGLMISCLVNTQLVAMLLSLLLIVPTIYFSGFAFVIDSMPIPFQVISNIVPARWFIDASRRLLIQGVEVRYVLKDAAILVLMAVVFIGISLKLFKKRLE